MKSLLIAIVLFLLFMLAASNGQAVEMSPSFGQNKPLQIEVGLGRSYYSRGQDGIWWQSQFGFTGDLKAKSKEVGIRYRSSEHITLHAAYVDLGRFTTDNIGTMRDDNVNDYDSTKTCNVINQRNCLGTFTGSGRLYGLLAGLGVGQRFGKLTVELEAGEFYYKGWWRIIIQCPACGNSVNAGPDRFDTGHTYQYDVPIRRTHYAALNLRYGPVYLSLRDYLHINNDGVSGDYSPSVIAPNKSLTQLVAGLSFNF